MKNTATASKSMCNRDYSLSDHLMSWFDLNGVSYEFDEDESCFFAHIQGRNGLWHLVVEIDLRVEQVYFSSPLDGPIPVSGRQAAMEYITRANFGMRLGHFELDLDDGELQFKSGIRIGDAPLSDEQVDTAIHYVIGVMDRYFYGLMVVVYGDSPPVDEIQEIEHPEFRHGKFVIQ